MKTSCHRLLNRAFTMTEILVVCAIIGVLASMAILGIGSARKKKNLIVCINNIKQWGYTWENYSQDNDQAFPGGQTSDWRSGNWMRGLRRFYNSGKGSMETCPFAKHLRPGANYGGGKWAHRIEGGKSASYGFNYWLYNPPQNTGTFWGQPVTNLWRSAQELGHTKPEDVPMMSDSLWRGGFPVTADRPAPVADGWRGSATPGMWNFAIDRHGGGVNVLFLDSHIERYYIPGLWMLKWHRNFDTGNMPEWPSWVGQYEGMF